MKQSTVLDVHLPIPWATILIAIATLVSAIFVVHETHHHRTLISQLEKTKEKNTALAEEMERLNLDKSIYVKAAYIEQTATKLGLIRPQSKQIHYPSPFTQEQK